MINNNLIDNHIHIGQYKNIYYDPKEIFSIVLEAGIDKLYFSSTTTCKNNVKYNEIEKEINDALSIFKIANERILPMLWFAPDYMKQGITVEKVMQNLPYKGIKIHPFAQNWDLNNNEVIDSLHNLFDYAQNNDLPILIHTGEDSCCEANKFVSFFIEYSNVKCILAHGRPIKQVINLMHNYLNVFCDTAFMEIKEFNNIIDEGLGNKIITGSDFPITHYYYHVKKGKQNNIDTLKKQYKEDIEKIKKYIAIIARENNLIMKEK